MAERLGRYLVLRHLASGGMADVLLARTDGIEGFARHVVLKRIRAEHAKDQRFIAMFLDEARLAATLHHQNVVQVHDIGEADGEYFFAMEYLHGEDLRTMLSIVSKTRTHMPLGYVVSVISSVAAGLHYAHERRGPDKKPLNIVHRDVSPSNILVGYDGSVKVVDFGIAKAAMRQVETRSGSLKGKVSYMSPEQCKHGAIDRRSDVYALGVVLYELATTTRLFKSDSDYLVMDAICTGKIPLPRVRRPDLPNELQAIIMKALATDPDRRYQTADEMRVALDAFAAKAQLTASANTIASYVLKLCGEKPEPWLETTDLDDKPAGADTVADRAPSARAPAGEDPGRMSWSGLPVATPAAEAKTVTDGKTKQPGTTTKLGWEQAEEPRTGRGFTPAKIAMVVVPVLALVAVLVWKVGGSSDAQAPAVAQGAATIEPDPSPGPQDRTVDRAQVEAPRPESGSAAAPPTPPTTPPTRSRDPKPAVATTNAPTPAARAAEPKAAKAPTTEDSASEPKVGSTTVAAPPIARPGDSKATPTPASVPAAVATPAAKPIEPKPGATTPTATTAPKPGDPKAGSATSPPPPAAGSGSAAPMATLAPGVVEQLASKHRKALLACEAGEALQGDVTIRFQINGEGQVVRSAAQSTLGKQKVSDCILLTLRGWRFPKPPSGSAAGVYSISFQ